MGWGRTLLLGDIGNRLDIEDAEHEIALLRQDIAAGCCKDSSQDKVIRALVAENAEMKLYFVSLVRLLTKKGSISKEELQAMVAAIDAEDGRADGQYAGKIG